MLVETIDPLPVTLAPGAVGPAIRFVPGRGGIGSLDALVALAQGLLRPRAAYGVAFVGAKGERAVEVAGISFDSLLLRRNLDAAQKVFPYIITVGPELERAAGARGDLLEQYYLEELANIALESAAGWLGRRLEGRYGVGGLAGLSPGSLEDWPLAEQAKLFSLFGDTESLVGVRLTESLLMVPRKSISGIFFPSEEGFVACRLCDRERCPSRKAAYAGDGPAKGAAP
jgi:hypothetical protein